MYPVSGSDPPLCIQYQFLHYVSSIRPSTMYPVSDPPLCIQYQTLHYVSNQLEFLYRPTPV